MIHGLRPAEACALCWDKVNLKRRCFCVGRSLSRLRLIETTNERRDEGPLALGAAFIPTLESLPKEIGPTLVFVNSQADRSKNPLAFYTPDFLNKLWREALNAADLPRIRLYNATRHSAGMRWLSREKADAVLVARLLRHTNLKQMDVYARHNLDIMRDVIDGHHDTQAKKDSR